MLEEEHVGRRVEPRAARGRSRTAGRAVCRTEPLRGHDLERVAGGDVLLRARTTVAM